jgi:Spy/CpxP family protein refolding chaperone
MKQVLLWSGALLGIVVLGIMIARADSPLWHRWHHGRNPIGRMSSELNLNSTQKAQIKSIWEAERPSIANLVRDFAAESKEMESITGRGNFDQAKAQAIADRQGATVAQLLMQKQKLQSQIYTVLTPAQRTKADELEKRWDSRIDWIANRLDRSIRR